jgi:hypothetical protein
VHIPVGEQHRHIHSTEDENNMEPGILKGVTRGRTIEKGAYIITGTRTLVIMQFTNVIVVIVIVVIKCRRWNGPGKASL